MDPRAITKLIIMKRLVESLPEDKRERNLPAIEKTANKIMGDLDELVQNVIGLDSGPSRAPKQRPVKGLAA